MAEGLCSCFSSVRSNRLGPDVLVLGICADANQTSEQLAQSLRICGVRPALRDSCYLCGSGKTYIRMAVAPIVRKKTASCGWAGHMARVRPSIHAPVPIALANREAFKVFTESAPANHALPSIQDTLSNADMFREKWLSVGDEFAITRVDRGGRRSRDVAIVFAWFRQLSWPRLILQH